MTRILVISSYVAFDPIGLAPAVAPMQRAGFDVVQLPTIVLSNHPAREHVGGTRITPTILGEMTDAIEANRWLGTFDAIYSGYLPSLAHVQWVRDLVTHLRALNPAITYICDPIIGDDPEGVYIDDAAAEAVRDALVPMADILTPNRFELGWLTGQNILSVQDAMRAAATLGRPTMAATSIPVGVAKLANILLSDGRVIMREVTKLPDVPHGTGDLFAGLLISDLLQGRSAEAALTHAVASVEAVLTASRGQDRLLLSALP
ncbi:pyridoxal kinase [Hyphomicrobium methylovorum]|uniref:pyridoxal kinase n=1 Tax=Hyphomicrobium methylovorum TaxID=84 RepID=UPI0015E734FF|nr:pyridoxal kinase [Hyphomicrobium methylovorum]MBA2126102.1 pyridoxal kinase [Hyphomicrobium methylovorum]